MWLGRQVATGSASTSLDNRTTEEDRSCRIFYALMLPRVSCPHRRPHHLVQQLLLSGPEELTQRAVAAAQRTVGGDLNSLEDVYGLKSAPME